MESSFNISICCSAILYVKDGKNIILEGKRHHNILQKINDMGDTFWYKQYHEDGFMFDVNGKRVFVNRLKASRIARYLEIPMEGGSTLTSEDLW